MQLSKIPIGQAFRLIDDNQVYLATSLFNPVSGMNVIVLESGASCSILHDQKVEIVTLIPIVLESEDLENLDRIIEIENQNENRASRVTRLLEGCDAKVFGAIAAELNYIQSN